MGTVLSTVNEMVIGYTSEMLTEATYRTIVGILLAVPFVMSGMNRLADKFRQRKKLRSDGTLVRSRAIMSGTMPSTGPTIIVHSQTRRSSAIPSLSSIAEEEYNEEPPVLIQLMDGATPANSVVSSPVQAGRRTCNESLEVKLLSTDEAARTVPKSLELPSLPPSSITIDVGATPKDTESAPQSPTASTVSTSMCSVDENTSTKEQQDVDTCTYLERCSKRMAEKAESAGHSDKVGIGKALYKLGEIVLKHKRYQKAYRIFKRAARVQEKTMQESIYSVAWAMREEGLKYSGCDGKEATSKAYLGAATKLIDQPNQDSLKIAWNTHRMLRPDQTDKATARVERRLKRAKAEWLPLMETRKKQQEIKLRMKLQS